MYNPSRSTYAPYLLAITLLALLAIAYLIAPELPVSFGWENGLIENIQIAALLLGGLIAIVHYVRTPADDKKRMFWLVVAPVWFILAVREMSWGAVLQPSIGMAADTGPVFSSSRLSYRPLVVPVIGALLSACIILFFKTRQLKTISALWKQKAFPLREIAMFVVFMAISAAAEGHGPINFEYMGSGAAQVFEELVELFAYVALLFAQWRVASMFNASVHTISQ